MAGSSWPDLVAGRNAKASEVEAKFDWLEGHIVPMLGGSQTDSVYNLGTSGARWLGVYTRSINPTTTAGGVAIGTTTANASALLDIAGTKAIILPRMTTTERDALTPVNGMLVYNTTAQQFQKYENSAWRGMGGSPIGAVANAITTTVFDAGATETITSLSYSGSGRIKRGFITVTTGADTNTTANVYVVIDGITSPALTVSGQAVSTSATLYLASASAVFPVAWTLGSYDLAVDTYFKTSLLIYATAQGSATAGRTTTVALNMSWEHD